MEDVQSAGGLLLQFVGDRIAGRVLEAREHCETLFVEVAGEGATNTGITAGYQDGFARRCDLKQQEPAGG